jgi:hypothetical protein
VTTHEDKIRVACQSIDALPHTAANEVTAENSCGCGVSTTKQAGSGCCTKHYKIHGCITVNEEIERCEKMGEKTCKDGRSYKCTDCMTKCDCLDDISNATGTVIECPHPHDVIPRMGVSHLIA